MPNCRTLLRIPYTCSLPNTWPYTVWKYSKYTTSTSILAYITVN